MTFEPGKYYKHETGSMIHTLQHVDTWSYGRCLLAESDTGEIYPVGESRYYSENYTEISRKEWEAGFEV